MTNQIFFSLIFACDLRINNSEPFCKPINNVVPTSSSNEVLFLAGYSWTSTC